MHFLIEVDRSTCRRESSALSKLLPAPQTPLRSQLSPPSPICDPIVNMALQGTLNARCTFSAAVLATRRQSRRSNVVVFAAQSFKVAVLPGDGIGPEITKVALKAMEAAGRKDGVTFEFSEAHIGGAAIDATGAPLPDETLALCKASDAVLLAAIGGCAAMPIAPPAGNRQRCMRRGGRRLPVTDPRGSMPSDTCNFQRSWSAPAGTSGTPFRRSSGRSGAYSRSERASMRLPI